MGALSRHGPDQFLVHFAELGRRGFGARSREPVQVDPYLLARAVAEVMRGCTVRSAMGRPLLWNDYRVILARADFEPLRVLSAGLRRDLREALATEAERKDAELVGELRVTVVMDESNELQAGHGVIRVAFVPTEKQLPEVPGEMTVRFDTRAVAGQIDVPGEATVHVADSATEAAFLIRWPSGEARLGVGATVVVGRPHADQPTRFVALTGASPRISKQHVVLTAGPVSVKVSRPQSANPVHVNGQLVPAGGDLEAAPPFEISLSRGDLILGVGGASG